MNEQAQKLLEEINALDDINRMLLMHKIYDTLCVFCGGKIPTMECLCHVDDGD